MIRLKHIDFNTAGQKRYEQAVQTAQDQAVFSVFMAPVNCVVERLDLYWNNAFSANTSDTLKMRLTLATDTNAVVGLITADTSAATNAFTPGQRITVIPTGNNSLTAGVAIAFEISCVCQAVPSSTVVVTTYRPVPNRANRG